MLAVWALAACSDSKPGATAATETVATAVNNDVSTEPTVVIDGKQWMRCSLGQTWDGKSCAGEPRTFTFDEAIAEANESNAKGGFYGKTDWGVPTVHELASLRICSNGFKEPTDLVEGEPPLAGDCKDGADSPTLDVSKFPNTPESSFWSSSNFVGIPSFAWYVNFYNGFVSGLGRNNEYAVRLVRASQ